MGASSATSNLMNQSGSYTGGNVDSSCSMMVPKGWYWEVTDNCQQQGGHSLKYVSIGS